jgi:hypothetical protein
MSGSGRDLSDETISLARVLVSLLPDEAGATSLLVLLLHFEARHVTRRELLICAPSIGGLAAYAATLHQSGNSRAAPESLARIPQNMMVDYQPYWAVTAHFLLALRRRKMKIAKAGLRPL